jgi:hypothetical protein
MLIVVNASPFDLSTTLDVSALSVRSVDHLTKQAGQASKTLLSDGRVSLDLKELGCTVATME